MPDDPLHRERRRRRILQVETILNAAVFEHEAGLAEMRGRDPAKWIKWAADSRAALNNRTTSRRRSR